MRSLIRFAVFGALISLSCTNYIVAQKVPKEFLNPSREFSVMPFWFWNDTLRDEEIIRQIADFEAHGVYGFVIHPRIGLPGNIKWLSPEMIHFMNVAISEAAKRKMHVILYDEGMYPSGSSSGQVVARNPAHAARGLAKKDLKPGETPAVPEGCKLVAVLDRPDGSRVAVIDQPSGGNIRGLHYIGEGQTNRLREETPAAGDILNPDAVTSFMELVYDRYAKEFGKYFGTTITGIFTDEPSPLGRGSEKDLKPGNALIIPQINKILGYDITPFLSDLWYEDNPDSKKHRIDYLRAVNICLEENYYRRLGNWCRDHGIALMGHPAGSMDIGAERYFQIPGQDLVWRYVEPGQKALSGEHSTMAKCASSAMLHLGFQRNSNELYGAYGHNLTFDEMEWLAGWCFVRGQNLLIPHAFYYSIRGPRFDERPPDVGPNSAWWKDYKSYADACRRLSWLNTGSKQICETAILGEATWLPYRTAAICYRNQRDFNYLEIRHLWEDAKVDAGGIHIAGMTYKNLILDSLSAIPDQAMPSLTLLAANGRLIIWKDPSYSTIFKGAITASNSDELIAAINKTSGKDLILVPSSENIRYRHVVKGKDHYYILFNEGESKVAAAIKPAEKGNYAWIDPKTAEVSKFEARTEFNPHELKVLFLFTSATKPVKNKPFGLMVEFIREPAGVPILDLKPEFSWIVPEQAVFQTSYRIMVSSTKEKLQKNLADIWDSGKIESNISTEVELGGSELAGNTNYYWKVIIWDQKNKPSDYSEIQSFKTGAAVNYLTTRNKFQISTAAPVQFVRKDNGSYFIDFGKDAFGKIVLEIDSRSKDTVIIQLGEKLSGEKKIDDNPGGSIRYQKILLPVEPGKKIYLPELQKDLRNTGPAAIHLPDSFGIITPFRYCEVGDLRTELAPSDVSRKIYTSYFDDTNSSFTSSDTILNQVWDLCKYSIKATSFAGIYIDGDRERIPYEADAYINQLGHYYTDREYSLGRLSNEYFIDHPTWPTEWLLHTVPMFYNDFMFTGNIESVKNYYRELREKTLLALAGEDGLISAKNCTDEIMGRLGFLNRKDRLRDIVDWPPAQKDTGWKLVTPEGERDGYDMVEVNTVVNAFYYRSLVCMAELAREIGNMQDAELFRDKASQVKLVFNEKLLDKSTGIYIDGVTSKHSSLHANMMALAFNLVPDGNKNSVIEFIKSRGMACSVYGSQYLLEGLYGAGEAGYALNLLTSTGDRSWWNMIRSGSTITLEAWDMKYKPNSDWNHAWGAAPANIIPGFMWGISPAAPGYSKAFIRPQLDRLKSSSVSVPTIRGNISAEFGYSEKSKEYRITIPANMKCDFILPELKGKSFKFNGKNIRSDNGILNLQPGLNKILIDSV